MTPDFRPRRPSILHDRLAREAIVGATIRSTAFYRHLPRFLPRLPSITSPRVAAGEQKYFPPLSHDICWTFEEHRADISKTRFTNAFHYI